MPDVRFGRKDEPSFRLERRDDLIAVRTRSQRSLRAGPVEAPAAAELQDAELVLAFPEAGVEVYRIPTRAGARSAADRKEALRRAPDVRFAGGVLEDPQSGEPVVYTENLFVKFLDTADPDECKAVLRDAGLTIKQEVEYATNAYFVSAPENTGTAVFDIANSLLEREDVEYAHPEIVRERAFRALHPHQWHLRTTTIGSVEVAASANVVAAHEATLGEGITICIIDDGVDIEHPEFAAPGKIVAPRDATLGTADPRPKDPPPFGPENHGTACAGVACADGAKASGVAPRSRLMPIRLSSGLGSQQEANAFRWAADEGADIISCSWGPPDGRWYDPDDPRHTRVVPLPASTKLAIDYATTHGRAGKGCVVLFAAGNGRESVDHDGYASYERVIAVAACNDRSRRSVYSDFGDALWCAFPSSDSGYPPFDHPEALTAGIWTTDRRGTHGYNRGREAQGDVEGDYTNSFGGTSSSCPGAAGVAALVLAVNPELRWQEVRDVLARSCDRIDPQEGHYDAVTGRSRYYGHGRLNAARAVELARPQEVPAITISRRFNTPLPDLREVSVALEVTEDQPIEALAADIEIRHGWIGDLVVTLIPPDETALGPVVLHRREGGSRRLLHRRYDALTTPSLAALRGKSAHGTWHLQVQDRALFDRGTLVSFGLELKLAPATRHPAVEPTLERPLPRRPVHDAPAAPH